ncbi:MAG TPA: hypothetical protein PLZ57_00620 [Pseudobdellovibrionaceae bacterium]|nr:hypothetical protein [Pseudobdellovibrionaceae bacterium]
MRRSEKFKVWSQMIATAFVALTLISCSAGQRDVVNVPPTFSGGVSGFALEEGTFKIESATMFLWPAVGEDELASVIALVHRNSAIVDHLTMAIAKLGKDKEALETQFATEECVKKHAVLAADEDPEFVEWVAEWKADAPESCKQNQDQRRQIVREVDRLASQEQPKLIGAIYKAIDPGYPQRVENLLSMTPKDSMLLISSERASEVLLKDFRRKGNAQSSMPGASSATHGQVRQVIWRPELRVLRFSVPELDEQNRATGSIWNITLERQADFLGRARFAGEIRILSAEGRVLRTGQMKLEGRLSRR